VKCAVIAWSGTADSVTSDIISAWGAEGTNPTLIANATYENTPVNLNVTTSFATYSVTANVDTASTSNIIVFIWSDVTDTTAGDFLYITNAQLEVGTSATPFERRLYGQELANCQRYFETLTSVTWTNVVTGLYNGIHLPWKVTMRSSPTVTTFSTVTNTSGKIRYQDGASDVDSYLGGSSVDGGAVAVNNTNTNVGSNMFVTVTANSEL
jgi:hypothetical protein